jgi:tRNA-dihydrouridine synthase 3
MGAIDNTNAPPAEKEASASTEVKKEGMSAPPPAESGASAPTEVKKEGTSAPPAESGASAPIEVKKEGTSAPPAENGAKRIDDRDRTDQNNRYSLKLKSEFVLSERASSLTPMEKVEDTRGVKVDDRDNQSGKKGKKFKNKKRPRDARQDDSEKICMSVIRGDKCSFGEGCKFSHDIKAYMATRPVDITEVEGCPNYNLHGYCTFGVACRFGGCHINKAGENIHKDAVDTPGVKPDVPLQETSINSLPRDVQIQLRKNKYDFKCKRHFETKKDKEEPKEGEVDKSESPKNLESSTPVELKTRKIIDFANKVYVAPLTTVGNLPFRRMMKKFGADITCGEMAIATCLLEGKPSEWALLKRHPDEDVFGVQVAAAHPDQYTRACELIEEFCTVDFVDLNLGCPLDLVCSKGAGAALMNREKKLRSSLEGINKTLSCPFTVKMRTGWDMAKPFAHQLVPKIQSWGIDGIGAFMVRFDRSDQS